MGFSNEEVTVDFSQVIFSRVEGPKLIEGVEEGRGNPFLESRLFLKNRGDRKEGGEVWEQKRFFKDGQDWNMCVVEKGYNREGEMEGLEEREEWQMEEDPA